MKDRYQAKDFVNGREYFVEARVNGRWLGWLGRDTDDNVVLVGQDKEGQDPNYLAQGNGDGFGGEELVKVGWVVDGGKRYLCAPAYPGSDRSVFLGGTGNQGYHLSWDIGRSHPYPLSWGPDRDDHFRPEQLLLGIGPVRLWHDRGTDCRVVALYGDDRAAYEPPRGQDKNEAPRTKEPLAFTFGPAKTNEHWMRDTPGIEDTPLYELCLPGSHDAGTYSMRGDMVARSRAQHLNMLEQLRAGSRYLDLRAQHYQALGGWPAGYYMHHGLDATRITLDSVVTQLAEFLDHHPDEIVIATLSLPDDTNNAEWSKQYDRLKKFIPAIPTLAEVQADPSKSIARVTPKTLRKQKTPLVLLRWGSAEMAGAMDREGVYDNYGKETPPQDAAGIVKLWQKYVAPLEKMWILHLGMPWTGGEALREKWPGEQQALTTIAGTNPGQPRKLNIINADFIDLHGWVDQVKALNAP